MAKQKDPADLKRLYEEIHTPWQDFYDYRREWTHLIDRRAPVEMDDAWKKEAAGIDIESPMLEDSRSQWIQILTLAYPKLDTVALDSSKDAKEDVEDVRIYLASLMQSFNEGGWLSASIAQGQVQYGVAVARLDWHMPEEPDEDYYGKKELKSDDAEGRLKARGDYFKEKTDHCFRVTDVSPMEMCWAPLGEPTVVFQRSQIPYSEAKNLERSKKLGGGKVRLADLERIYFLGDSEPDPEDAIYTEQSEQKTISLIIKDCKDPETGEWYTCEYVCLDGQEDKAELLDEYVNPLGQSRYIIIPSGREVPLATDPHLRYRPEMYPELVLTGEQNYLKQILTALARRQLNDGMFFVDASKLTPEGQHYFEDATITEGDGATRQLVMKRPEPGSNELVIMPGEVKPWPFPPQDMLLTRIEQIDRELLMVRPNRFLTGQAYANAKDPAPDTATQHLDQRQAAALPADAHLKKSDAGWADMLRACVHAMRYWDKDSEGQTQKQYHIVTLGDEPLLKKPREGGEEVVVTADKLKRRFHVIVKTTNETQAERIQKNLAADDALAKKAITISQWLELRGHDDPERQLEELEKQRLEEMTQKEFEPVEIMMIKVYASALTNLNLGAPLPPPLATQQQMGQPGMGQPGMGNNMIQAGPVMTPSPVEQPSGGSAPMGGVM